MRKTSFKTPGANELHTQARTLAEAAQVARMLTEGCARVRYNVRERLTGAISD